MTDLCRRRRGRAAAWLLAVRQPFCSPETVFLRRSVFGVQSAPANGFDVLWGRSGSRRNPYIFLYLMYPQAMPKEFRLLTG